MILLCLVCTPCVAQELPDAKPEVQAQIQQTFDTMRRLKVDSFDNAEVLSEAQKTKELAGDEEQAIEQLAVWVATTESSEDTHAIVALMVWRYLHVSPKATIRVLAPYLGSSNRALHGFVDDLLEGQDFEHFRDYARRQDAIPEPLVDFLFERSPGEALQVLQAGSVDTAAHLRIVREQLEATGDAIKASPLERREERASQRRRETLLAEHIVANALWLKKHGFNEQFREALPEAMAELEQLANHKQWWARLYVVYIMRQNPVLLQDHILRQLAEDENELVRKAAERRAAPNSGDGRRDKPRAPDKVQSRAVGPTSIEVTWQPSVGATSYSIQRRQPDTETKFTTIASGDTDTTYTDTGLPKDTLYEYRVIAHQDP